LTVASIKGAASGLAARPWWPWAKRGLTGAFFVFIAWLLIHLARDIEWGKVLDAARKYPTGTLAIGAGLAATSHLLYSTYDLFGRRHTGHDLPVPRVMLNTFISYAFNLNFGSLIGGVAFRYRLYDRLGLPMVKTTEVVAISILTNWLGYALVAGGLFVALPFEVPGDWPVGGAVIRSLGAVMALAAAAYVALCAFASRRTWKVRRHTLRLPSGRFALVQLGVSATSWMLMGGLMYTLLHAQSVSYSATLAVLLAAAVAGVVTYVPAGLGVLEAVYIALLSHAVPTNELLAAMLAYRGLYYWAPLALALLLYLLMETRKPAARSRRAGLGRPFPKETACP
jgi:uncharacterized membrane protein YbhN (UPF0104 family)